jgi:RPA family protein
MAETSETETQDEDDDGPRRREPARRLFAAEFNDAQHETQGEGEMAPSYVVTPLGAKVNRVFVVGVLTSNDPAGEDGSMQRAQVTDPTGVFYVTAGRYQPEALETLQELDPPQIVGVVGKARTYEPEEGTVYTSIQPETIHPMKSEDRDAWILETAEHTVDRVQAMETAYDLEEEVSVDRLVDEGLGEVHAEGIMDALSHYGRADLSSYLSLASDALGYLLPAPPQPEIHHAGEGEDEAPSAGPSPEPEAGPSPESMPDAEGQAAEPTAPAADEPEPSTGAEPASDEGSAGPADVDAEAVVFGLVEELDEGKGADWEDIVEEAQTEGFSEEEVEETMNHLMDRGRVFEPVLGKLKAT